MHVCVLTLRFNENVVVKMVVLAVVTVEMLVVVVTGQSSPTVSSSDLEHLRPTPPLTLRPKLLSIILHVEHCPH